MVLFSVLIVLLRFFAPISYDLVFYEQYYYLSLSSLEPLFKYLLHGLNALGIPFRLALIVLPFIWIYIVFRTKKDSITSTELWIFVILLFGSQFFTLGIMNAVRQFYSSLFILLPLMKDYIKLTKARVLIYFIIAAGLHWSSLLFFPLICTLYYISYWKTYRISLFIFISSIFSFMLLFKFLFIEDKYLTEFQDGRSSTMIKLIIIILYYSFSSLIVRKRRDMEYHRKFRFSLFLLLLILSMYGELFARLLFFFSCYEILFFFIYIKAENRSYVQKTAYILIFVFYNFFSPNVINVLWKQLLNF